MGKHRGTLCPRCKNARSMTTHHIIPQKLWKNTSRESAMLDGLTVEICWPCHQDLNRILETAEREFLFREFQASYIRLLIVFLKGGFDGQEVRGEGGYSPRLVPQP